jgi:Rrf2 family protein
VQISARSDYALRAMVVAASLPGGRPITAASLSQAQAIPLSFLYGILLDLRRAGLLTSRRGTEGGYVLARPAGEISVGDILRTVNGAFSSVRGLPPEKVTYRGAAASLPALWQSVQVAIADVVDHTTLTDLLVAAASD